MISPFSCLIYVFMQLVQRALVRSSAVMIHCPEVAWRQDLVPATQCVTADSTWKTWPQPVAATGCPGGWQYAKISPHGITERKRMAASCSWSVLLSYKPICMWAFRAPLRVGLCTLTVFVSLSLVGLVMNGSAAQLCVSQGGRSTGFLSPLTGLLTPL